MARCKLGIEFEGGRREYAFGETVSGRVTVQPETDAECKALSLVWQWRTHGKGNVEKGTENTLSLFAGTWQAGQDRSYPFSFVVPAGPATYHGRLINVEWFLAVRADIPWAVDPKAEENFVVVPRAVQGVPDLGPAHRQPVHDLRKFDHLQAAAAKVCLVIGLVGGGALLRFGYHKFQAQGFVPTLDLAFFLIPVAIFLVLAFKLGSNAMAQRVLGDVRLEVCQGPVRRGGRVEASLSFAPIGQAVMSGVVLRLLCQEVAVSGSGTNTTTHRHQVGEWALASDPGRDLSPGTLVRVAGSCEVPSDAPTTFESWSNRLTWTLEAEVRLAGRPDWTKSVPVVVLPSE